MTLTPRYTRSLFSSSTSLGALAEGPKGADSMKDRAKAQGSESEEGASAVCATGVFQVSALGCADSLFATISTTHSGTEMMVRH